MRLSKVKSLPLQAVSNGQKSKGKIKDFFKILMTKKIDFYTLLLLFIFQKDTFAFTWQDVMNSYNSCLASEGASDTCWIEEVATNSGKGYRVYRRQDASTTVDYASKVVTGASLTPLNCWTYFLCDGNGTTKIVDVSELNSTNAYDLNTGTMQIYNNFCDGSKIVISTSGPPWVGSCLFGASSTCWISSQDVNNCKSYDTLLAAFIPIDQCLNKLTNIYESCLQNCKDPVEKTDATEICGDGIDNNCNGEIDEGCKTEIELPMMVYQCESKFKTTPPYYDKTQNTICNSGCSLAAMTMVLNYSLNTAGLPMVDIESLNEWLNKNYGYDSDGGIKWKPLENYPDISLILAKFSNVEDTTFLNNELDNGNPVILKVFNSKTGRDHFVVAVGKSGSTWDIIDPGYQLQKTTLDKDYSNRFKGIRVYKISE